MRSINHLKGAANKQPWKHETGERYYIVAGDIKDSCLWDDFASILKKDGQILFGFLEKSIIIDEYRYWIDNSYGNLCLHKEHLVEQKISSSKLSQYVRKMIQCLKGMPDHSEVSTNELLRKVCHVEMIRELETMSCYTFMDGAYYSCYEDKKGGKHDIEWEIYNRFNAAAKRNGYIIDNSKTLYKCWGFPYNIASIYRRRAAIIQNASNITERDAVFDANGNIMYFRKDVAVCGNKDYSIIRIAPGKTTTEIAFLAENNTLLVLISGKVTIESSRFDYHILNGETNARWHHKVKKKTLRGFGEFILKRKQEDCTPPEHPSVIIHNSGDTEALLILSHGN